MSFATRSDVGALDRLRREITGYWRTFALRKCLQADLIGAIVRAGTITASDAARTLGVSAIQATLLLDYLVELELLVPDNQRWSATPVAVALLERGSERYAGDWLLSLASEDAIDAWQRGYQASGDRFGEIGDDPPRMLARDQVARHQARLLVDHLARQPWFASARLLIDFGCGSGRYLHDALAAHPRLTCVGVDRLAPGPRAYDATSITHIQGDLFDLPTLPAADLGLVSNLLHSYDDAACVSLLRSVRRAIAADGRLMLHHDRREPGDGDPVPVLASLHVCLTGCRGRVRSVREIAALCRAADLHVESSTDLGWMRLDVATP